MIDGLSNGRTAGPIFKRIYFTKKDPKKPDIMFVKIRQKFLKKMPLTNGEGSD